MSIIVIDTEIEIHKCDFGRCQFVTINHLDDRHIYCCIGEPVHFNMLTPYWRQGRCLKCKRVHVEFSDGRKESYMTLFNGRIDAPTFVSYPKDLDFVPNWAKGREVDLSF